ncbi:MAG: sensor histidine kinase [Selenomonadales bacterium]|nr:sensor histidine kinase [Selenomonadales bacterium]
MRAPLLWLNTKSLTYLALLTVFVSNFSFFPFGTGFRFSLAVSVFCFYLLMEERLSRPVAGLTTGVAVTVFRAGAGFLLADVPFLHGLDQHYPAGVFYLLLGVGLALWRQGLNSGGLDIVWALAFLDMGANIGELLVRGDFANRDVLPMFYLLGLVALVRGALTGLAFTAWRQREVIIGQEQKEREFRRLLLLTSDVTGELLYLENTLAHVETVMVQSHQLYKKLRAAGVEDADAALAVAREIHDAKKDFARLAARLRHVVVRESQGETLALSTLAEVAVKANQALAEEQGKEVAVHYSIAGQAEVAEYHRILAVINNLMGNAIEAIAEVGSVWLDVRVSDASLYIAVRDTGKGISAPDLGVVFEPGYTTKFNPVTGQASTGLGLAQVKAIVERQGGEITAHSEPGKGSTFTVKIPLANSSEG